MYDRANIYLYFHWKLKKQEKRRMKFKLDRLNISRLMYFFPIKGIF